MICAVIFTILTFVLMYGAITDWAFARWSWNEAIPIFAFSILIGGIALSIGASALGGAIIKHNEGFVLDETKNYAVVEIMDNHSAIAKLDEEGKLIYSVMEADTYSMIDCDGQNFIFKYAPMVDAYLQIDYYTLPKVANLFFFDLYHPVTYTLYAPHNSIYLGNLY